ncbi:hypothetical protein PIB30_020946, partial [Stylosanthes scabra]|nr:hypothetical protein [Stylosanthes scabra]
ICATLNEMIQEEETNLDPKIQKSKCEIGEGDAAMVQNATAVTDSSTIRITDTKFTKITADPDQEAEQNLENSDQEITDLDFQFQISMSLHQHIRNQNHQSNFQKLQLQSKPIQNQNFKLSTTHQQIKKRNEIQQTQRIKSKKTTMRTAGSVLSHGG